jgi:eukaryotic-like serine/threonine-protein kinase
MQIGPYKLLEQIGEGGFGVVFMAEQQQPLRRKVALKVLKPGMDTRQVVARFEAERQALALMDHPNIAKVLDAGATDSGRPYFVMDLVKGIPITEFCDQNQLTTRARLELFAQVCQAIQHAHQKGIIHRDIKPSNVLVAVHDTTPVVKVIDFGVAKALGQELTEKTLFTGFAQMIGTPLYMSPEQAGQSSLDVDTRSDIYSLGVMLYELLTGTTPFDKQRLKSAAFDEIRRIIREDEPPKPSTRLSDLGRSGDSHGKSPAGAAEKTTSLASIAALRKTEPRKLSQLIRGDLDWIVMKALEKDRARRYETANGLVMDIQRYLADEPVAACPPSAVYRLRKFARRNKAAFVIGVAATAVLITGVVGLAVSNALILRESNAKEVALREKGLALIDRENALKTAQYQEGIAKKNAATAEKARKKAAENETEAKTQEKLAHRRYYSAQMNLALQAWEAGHPARTLQLLEGQRPRFDEEDLRGFDWYYLWQLCQGHLRFSLPKLNVDDAKAIAVSPDGKTLATGHGQAVRLWDFMSGSLAGELLGHRNRVDWLEFAPDGKTLATSDQSVKLWDLATRKERVTLPLRQPASRFQFTKDSRILVLSGTKRVELWDVESNHAVASFGGSETAWADVAVAPDGNTVVLSSERSARIWRRVENEWRETPPVMVSGYYAPIAISPDGNALAIGGHSLNVYDLSTRQVRISLEGHTGPVMAIEFLHDGASLASGSLDRTVRIWDLSSGEQKTCIANAEPVYGLVLAPDASSVAVVGTNEIRVFDIAPPPPAFVLRHPGAVHAVVFAPDGKTLVSNGEFGTTLWDAVGGRQVTTFPTGTYEWCSNSLACSPDGNTLATPSISEDEIDLWDMKGRRSAVLKKSGRALAFSPNGKWLAAATDGSVVVWDVASHQRRFAMPISQMAFSVAFSPDSKTVAAGGQFGVVKLYDTESGRELNTLQRQELAVDFASSVAFSPDGRKVAVGNWQGQVRIWDATSNQLDMSLIGHTDAIRAIAFLDGGKTLATASVDRTIRLWDVATGQERIALKGHENTVTGVAVAPDGSALATSSTDGTVRLWRASSSIAARALKREVDQNDAHSPAAHNERGDRAWQYGRVDDAESAYKTAIGRLEKLQTAFPGDPAYSQELVRSLLSESLLLRTERNHQAAAIKTQELALEVYRNLSPGHRDALLFDYGERHRKVHWLNAQQGYRIYSQLVELIPKDDPEWLAQAAFHLANCADLRLRDPVTAAALTQKAIALAPDDLMIRIRTLPPISRTDAYAQALADLRAFLKEHPQQPLAARLALAQRELQWGSPLAHAGQFRAAAQAFAEAAAGFEAVIAGLAEHAESATAGVPATAKDIAWYRHELGYVLTFAGEALRLLGRLPEAEAALNRGLQVHESLVHDADAPADAKSRLAWTQVELSMVLQARGSLREAEQKYREAAALMEGPGKADYDLNASWEALAQLCEVEGRTAEAIEAQRKAVAAWEHLASETKQPQHRFRQAWANERLAAMLLRANESAAAVSAYREAVDVLEAFIREQPDHADHYFNCGLLRSAFASDLFTARDFDSARKEFQEAIAAYTKVIEQVPDNAVTQNNLAWLYATCPETELRDPAKAVALARKAVELQPADGSGWNTLGAAQYRAGDWQAAVEALTKSMELRSGGDAEDWYFLAMAHRRLGHVDDARKWHQQAVEWQEKNAPLLASNRQVADELRRFRAEAEEVLGKQN